MIIEESIDFLKTLIDCASPSGFEQQAIEAWKQRTQNFSDEISVDVHGNCIAKLSKAKSPKVMLAGHIDEIGYMIKYIDKNGYLYFSCVGGIDLHLVPGQRVWIKTDQGRVLGVIGKKPIHMLEESERKKVSKLEQMWIDIGCSTKEQASKIVEIGDVAVPAVGYEQIREDKVVGRGFDDKVGAFVVSEVLKELTNCQFNASVYGVATVQEEIGLRGARTSCYGISPDIGIAIDVAFASDFPQMDKKKIGQIDIGKGPVIARGPNINKKIFDLLIQTAKQDNIPYQVVAAPRATGTDANVIQLTKQGVATALIGIPLRYMHTPVELISLIDVENAVKLLKSFIIKLDQNTLSS
jgi:putative aminopeptidase FrvX